MIELDSCRRPRAARRLAVVAVMLVVAGCHDRADRGRDRDRDGMMDDGMMDDGMMGDGMMGDGMMDDGMMDDGMMGRQMPDWMMSGGRCCSGKMMQDMRVIHRLLMQHGKIERRVEDIPGGVQTITVSADPEVAALIRTHVQQMKERLESGDPIRMMDPLFREIFQHHDAIRMEIEEIEGGVRVTERSDDPKVTMLIRQHAHRAVSEFVERGMQRAMETTPLPEGYRPPGASVEPGTTEEEAPR